MKKKTQAVVLQEFITAHENKYDYRLMVYRGGGKKVTVICPTHGAFEVTPYHHAKNGSGCRKCYADSLRVTLDAFIEQANRNFDHQYDYSLITRFALSESVEIFCNVHKVQFPQSARNHYRGHMGCSQCVASSLTGPSEHRGKIRSAQIMLDQFILRARQAHGDKYGYSEFEYRSETIPGLIICHQHGPFRQSPFNHTRGADCPRCAQKKKHSGSIKSTYDLRGAAYFRAMKRIQNGHPLKMALTQGYVRQQRKVNPITVFSVAYPNFAEACRQRPPLASPATVRRWIAAGMSPETAFCQRTSSDGRSGCIYRVTCLLTNKIYIGLTVQPPAIRWLGHIRAAHSGGVLSSGSLHDEIRRFGAEAFKLEVVDTGLLGGELENKERSWIKESSSRIPFGMNISAGGTSGGSRPKKTTIDQIVFKSAKAAAMYLSKTKAISLTSAKWRVAHNKTDCRTLAKQGESLVRSHAYKTWSFLVQAKANQKSKHYDASYVVCERWNSFESFVVDLGHPPPRSKLHRLDKDVGYSKSNCVWLPVKRLCATG